MKVEEERSEGQTLTDVASTKAKTKSNLPDFHTRLMKRLFKMKLSNNASVQLMPRNPYVHSALNFTKYTVQFNIQRWQLRLTHVDAHYCTVQLNYMRYYILMCIAVVYLREKWYKWEFDSPINLQMENVMFYFHVNIYCAVFYSEVRWRSG